MVVQVVQVVIDVVEYQVGGVIVMFVGECEVIVFGVYVYCVGVVEQVVDVVQCFLVCVDYEQVQVVVFVGFEWVQWQVYVYVFGIDVMVDVVV